MPFLNQHPEAMEALSSFFKTTGFDPIKRSHQKATMARVSEMTVRQFYD